MLIDVCNECANINHEFQGIQVSHDEAGIACRYVDQNVGKLRIAIYKNDPCRQLRIL